MEYTFKSGLTVPVREVDMDTRGPGLFKINLPGSLADYDTGNGEGVWARANPEYNIEDFAIQDDAYEIVFVRILNRSLYYPGLNEGMYVPVELRDHRYRPVAAYSELLYRYGPSQKDKVLREYLKYKNDIRER